METDLGLDHTEITERPAVRGGFPWPLLLFGLVLAALVGGVGGYLFKASRVPTADSVDVGFARDMSIHHEQAIQMATLILDRTEDEAIKSLAYDILTTQQGQIGIMSGWLDAWDVPWTSAGPRMTWMGMSVDGLMPGMATPEQMASLRNSIGAAADIIFLQLMIPHHLSGVEMAQFAADNARSEPAHLLAQSMVDAQTLEVEYMQELLVGKGQLPLSDAEGTPDEHDH